MLTPLMSEVADMPDLSHQARRFRTVAWSFGRNTELLFAGREMSASVNPEALAQAFSEWRRAFDVLRSERVHDRRDLVIFAAGLMLRELIRRDPLCIAAAESGRTLAVEADPGLGAWPQGYAYASYCFTLAAAVLEEQDDELRPTGVTEDGAFWASFHENVLDDPSTSIGFFDLICGNEPNWGFPWDRRGSSPRALARQ